MLSLRTTRDINVKLVFWNIDSYDLWIFRSVEFSGNLLRLEQIMIFLKTSGAANCLINLDAWLSV